MLINVFLLRTTVATFGDAVDQTMVAEEIAGAAAVPFQCRFFLGPEREGTPPWFEFIQPGLIRNLPNFTVSGVSGVLVLQASNRFFAITFGRGRFMLRGGIYEEDFGLKVALNRIAENDLKSIDTKVYDEIVTSSRIQVSRDARIESFGIDVSRSILRAVQGKPRDPRFATRLAGADSLTIARTGLTFDALGTLCAELLTAYGETTYQQNFKWVDNVRQVRDGATIASLDAALVQAMQTRNLGNMHLTLTDLEDAVQVEAFQFTKGGGGEYRNLELNAYLQLVLAAGQPALDAATLKRHRIKIRLSGETDFKLSAFIYESLVWETNHNGGVYAFFDGRWFRVDQKYAHEIDTYWRGLLLNSFPLPDANLADNEADYNQRVAAADARIALFDCVRMVPTNATSAVELCDLMSNQGHFIHVKWRYGSSAFSHLFAQGTVGFETFLNDGGYRAKATAELTRVGKNSHFPLVPTGRPDPGAYEIIYAVIAPANIGTALLPFFSAVNLKQHGNHLKTIGVKLSLQHIVAR